VLRDFYKAAMEQSRYITPNGIYRVFDFGDKEKQEVANSLKHKGIKAKTFNRSYALMSTV